jgi:hypothetical protein
MTITLASPSIALSRPKATSAIDPASLKVMVADIDIIPGSAPWLRLARRAKLLAAFTLMWLGIEGTVGVIAGMLISEVKTSV